MTATDGDPSRDDHRVEEVLAGMYAGAEETKRRELETALGKLDHHGELTPEKREAVAALADALVARVLASPTASLRDAAARGDHETVETAVALFDPSTGDAGAGSNASDGERAGNGVDAVPTAGRETDD